MQRLRYAALIAPLLSAALLTTPAARAEGWGTIKGQVVFGGDKVPKPKPVKVDKDQAHCLSKGPILDESLLVNPKNKGVKYVVVWLAKDDGGKADHTAALPLHKALKAPKKKEVVMDQPCCKFEPRIVALRPGQTFVGKNSAPIPHNMNVAGANGVNTNQLLPAGGKMEIAWERWKPRHTPSTVSCNIHGWMKGYVFVFPHPYFAITDANGNFEIKNAPAGKYRMIAWQESIGWVLDGGKNGKEIEVKAGGETDVGKIELKK